MRRARWPVRRVGWLSALVALVLDQATKLWAFDALWPPYSEGVALLPVLGLRLGFNSGITFGIFAETAANAVWIVVLATAVLLGVLLVWLWRSSARNEAIALGLVIGGALGNLLDRLRLGVVLDFIDAHYAGWHWPTFNMADVAIVCGTALLLLAGLDGRAARRPPGAAP